MQFIDLHRQYDVIEEKINKRLKRIFEDKHFIGGEDVQELEKNLAEYVGVKHVVACASGTDALTIPMMALELKKEDAVFVPSFTFFATGESVSLAGGTPVFVDSCKDTFNMDVNSLESVIKKTYEDGSLKPRGIIAVDLFGLPANFNDIRKIADKYNLFLIEDAAQGFGGTIDNKKACSFGDIATTSFFPAKPLGCYGDGGAIFTNSDELYEKIKSIHIHGQGKDKYDNVMIGLNSRLDTIQAAILIEKLNIFDEELIKRNRVASLYTEHLKNIVETPTIPSGYTSSWAQYTLKLKSEEDRNKLINALKAEGIPSMVYYPIPMHKSTAYSKSNSDISLKNCEALSKSVLSLPMHPYLSDDELEKVCYIIKNYYEGEYSI